jgi:hypothetical protein
MGVKVNSELAAFFETGDQPSQTEFGHLIDSMLPTPVLLNVSTQILNRTDHQGRTLIVPDVSSITTYTMPAPLAAGEHYHFIYGGASADLVDHKFLMTTALLKGSIQFLDNEGSTNSAILANGTSHHAIEVNGATGDGIQTYDIHFLAYSPTVVYVWGFVGSDLAPTFQN